MAGELNLNRSDKENKILFQEWDRHSNELRHSVGGLIKVLEKINHSPIVNTLCKSLRKLKSASIEDIDDVMLEINKNTQLAFIELCDGDDVIATSKIMDEYINNSEIYTLAAEKFAKKGNELNQRV